MSAGVETYARSRLNRIALSISAIMTTKETGLPMDAIFLSFQLRSLDPSRIAGLSPAGIAPRARL